jgi:uncharacterized protein CbrC (UPF0167 family)
MGSNCRSAARCCSRATLLWHAASVIDSAGEVPQAIRPWCASNGLPGSNFDSEVRSNGYRPPVSRAPRRIPDELLLSRAEVQLA